MITEIDTKQELRKKALAILNEAENGGVKRETAKHSKAAVLMLLALYEQNEEIIRQNETIIKYPK